MATQAPLASLRSLLTGLTCGLGAVVAHLLAGGRIDALTAGLAIVVPVVLARALTRKRLNVYGAAAVALFSQALLHFVFVASCASAAGCLLGPGQMLLTHVLTAAFSVSIVMGGEAAIWRLVQAAALHLGLILPTQVVAVPAVPAAPLMPRLRALTAQYVAPAAGARGPPAMAAFVFI